MEHLSIEQKFYVDRKRKTHFAPILLFMTTLCFTGAYYLSTVEILPPQIQRVVRKIETQFTITQPAKPKPKPIVKPKRKPKPKKVYDLSEPVKLKAKVDVKEPVKQKKKKVRRVYGVKKVYSKGLGSGGSMSNAVVGKVGNTVNKDFDTTVATKEDLLGQVVSAVTVTAAPKFKERVKAELTEEIRKSGVSGVVKVKVLVDIDGKVKKAIAKNDLGFGTKESAISACLKMEFHPAHRGEDVVAVWITIPVGFEKIC